MNIIIVSLVHNNCKYLMQNFDRERERGIIIKKQYYFFKRVREIKILKMQEYFRHKY